MSYRPPRAIGLIIGAAMVAWALVVAGLLLLFASGREADLFTVVAYIGIAAALAFAVLFGYWTAALATMSYTVDRNGLVIRWGFVRQVVPLQDIRRLVPGSSVGVPRVSGVAWLGHHVGQAHIDRIGPVLFYSTHQAPEEVLYVMTAERNYAISVTEPASFAREIQVRQDLGPTANVRHHVEHTYTTLQAMWSDRTGLLLAGIAIALCGLLWIAVGIEYNRLPSALQIVFPPSDTGTLAEFFDREVVVEIPRTATLLLGANLVAGFALYAWDRSAGYALFIAASAVQVGFFIAFQLLISDV